MLAFVLSGHSIANADRKYCATWIRASRGHRRNQSIVQPDIRAVEQTNENLQANLCN